MKKIILSLFFFTVVFNVFSQEILVSSKIDNVTLFLNKAQIHRKASKTVNTGISTLKIEGLSSYIDPSSIQVKGKGSFTILSVSHAINYLKNSISPKIKTIKDSLNLYEDKLALTSNTIEVYKEEKKLILANKNVNSNVGFDIEDLDDLATLYKIRLTAIFQEVFKLNKKVKIYSNHITRLRKQLNYFERNSNKNSSEIIIEIATKIRTTARLSITYVVNNAGWNPIYDVRVLNADASVTINYKAQVHQNTGENWDKIQLKLSTHNPSQNATKPSLTPWRLDFQPTYNYRGARSRGAVATSEAKLDESNAAKQFNLFENGNGIMDAETVSDYTQVNNNQIHTEFEIALPYTIPSDGKNHLVNIFDFELSSTYKYFTAPKIVPVAFLVAQTIGWNKHNLLSGAANLFYEGSYLGKTYINTNNLNDTLDISLGKDYAIIVERKIIKEFTEKKMLGSSRKESFGYRITIKNNKKSAINIEIEDQIPLSKNKDIEVEVIELSAGTKDNENGSIKWKYDLPSGTTKKMELKYNVKYPKNKKVNL